MKSVYHLHLTDEQIEGAKIALLPGDPARVEKIARTAPLERPRFLASKREYTTWLSYIGQTPVLTTSTGIGGPSTAIAVEELAQLGVREFFFASGRRARSSPILILATWSSRQGQCGSTGLRRTMRP
jgi:uridine phosphorylase